MVSKKLSHYKILEELGRGGMGIVYNAEDTKLDRTVAKKVLPSAALASEDDRARFYREVKAAAQFAVSHVSRLYDFDGTHRRILTCNYGIKKSYVGFRETTSSTSKKISPL